MLNKNGTRIHHRVRLRQYLFDGKLHEKLLTLICDSVFIKISENGNLTRQRFAYLDRTDNYTFTFEAGFDDSSVFPGVYFVFLCETMPFSIFV